MPQPLEVSPGNKVRLLGYDLANGRENSGEPGSGRIEVKPGAPVGGYAIEVGMYDAATGQRLQVLSLEGESLGDRVLLPEQVWVK